MKSINYTSYTSNLRKSSSNRKVNKLYKLLNKQYVQKDACLFNYYFLFNQSINCLINLIYQLMSFSYLLRKSI